MRDFDLQDVLEANKGHTIMGDPPVFGFDANSAPCLGPQLLPRGGPISAMALVCGTIEAGTGKGLLASL